MTNTNPARIYLKTPERKWLWLGGLAACILPALCGIVLVLLFNIATSDTGEFELLTPRDLVFFTIPLGGAIIAAYLAIREIQKKNQFGFSGAKSIIWIAIKSGFYAHCIITIGLCSLILFTSGGRNINAAIGLVLSMTPFMLGIWMFLTLPVSALCGLIFWSVAVRGGENLMAEVFD